MENPVIEFLPLDLSHLSNGTENLLQEGLSKMERRRNWSGEGGIAEMLGEEGSSYIESVLARGGTVIEVGGGEILAASELASRYPNGHIVVVEPFADLDKLQLPENVKVVVKKLEDAEEILDGSVDGLYSGGHVLNYVSDKLEFLTKAWKLLKSGSKAYIEYFGSPTNPSLQKIVNLSGNDDIINVDDSKRQVNIIRIQKSNTGTLDFGKYHLETSISGNFPGDINTTYFFEKDNVENK